MDEGFLKGLTCIHESSDSYDRIGSNRFAIPNNPTTAPASSVIAESHAVNLKVEAHELAGKVNTLSEPIAMK